MPYLICWLFKTNIKYKDSDKDGVILRVFPLDGGLGGRWKVKRTPVFYEAPTAPSGRGDGQVLKAVVFKASLIFVSAQSDPAWL